MHLRPYATSLLWITLLAACGGSADSPPATTAPPPAPAPAPPPPPAPAPAPPPPPTAACDPGQSPVFSCTGTDGNPILLCIELAASHATLTLQAAGRRVEINADTNAPDYNHYMGEGQDNKTLHFSDDGVVTNYDVSEVNANGEHYGAVTIVDQSNAPDGVQVRCQALPTANWSEVESFKR